MALPKYDLNQVHQPQTQIDTFKHPDLGYMTYEPQTMRIRGHTRDRLSLPVNLAGVKDRYGNSFIGTPQPYVRTCTQPTADNAGCPKWAGCPLKSLPHVGPVAFRIRHNDEVSYGMCTDLYETLDAIGRPMSQSHMLMDGWRVDTDDITHPIMSNKPVGRDPITMKVQTKKEVWHRIIPNLAPPYWPMVVQKIKELVSKGEPVPAELALPRSAALYPELVGEDECGVKDSGAASPRSASPSGRRKRTGSTTRRARRGTGSTNAASAVESSD